MKSRATPKVGWPLVATKVSSEARTGPVQGAATMPATRPMANAPPYPVPPTRFSRWARPWGTASSKAPNMLLAITTKKRARPTSTQRFDSTVPNAAPLEAAARPMPENIAAMPST